jgi:hypothetical protein
MEKIYLIEDINDLRYVGRTTQKLLRIRLSGHRNDKRRGNFCSSSKLNLGNCNISLLEECFTEEAREREMYWINKIDCVNHIIPPKTENVSYCKRDDRWIYKKIINNKIHQKCFKTEEEAIHYKEIFELNPIDFMNVRIAKNVSYDKSRDRWRYQKMISGKIHCKWFKTEQEALDYKLKFESLLNLIV